MRPVNSIDELLEHMVARDASDLHVTVGTPPVIRVRGEVERLDEYAPLTPEDTQQLLYRILSSEQQKQLRDQAAARLLAFDSRPRPLPRQRLLPARVDRRGLSPDPGRDEDARGARHPVPRCTCSPRSRAASSSSPGRPAPVSRRRSRRSDRRDQPEPFRAHPHDRGPDRVPAPPQALHRQPARDRPGRHELRAKRCVPPCARTPT